MSYEIIYKTFTIKKGDKYIPLIVWGSNNCYEVSYSGRQKRERDLDLAHFLFNGKKEFLSLFDMQSCFKFDTISEGMNGGSLQGNYKTPHGLLKSFQKYVFNSGELKIKPRFISLHYLKMNEKEKERITNIFRKALEGIDEILTEEETKNIVDKCLNKLDEKTRKKVLEYRQNLICYPYSEYTVKYAFKQKYNKTKNKKCTTWEDLTNIINSDNAVDFNKDMTDIEFENRITPFFNKQVVLKSYGSIIRGRIKKTHKGDIGFFKYGIRNRYNILSKNDYGYANLKVDKIVEIK